MPYAWVDPHCVVTHMGVSVYRTYDNGYWDDPQRFHYTTDIAEQEEPFDIRDLNCYSEGTEHEDILHSAIELGEVKMNLTEQMKEGWKNAK